MDASTTHGCVNQTTADNSAGLVSDSPLGGLNEKERENEYRPHTPLYTTRPQTLNQIKAPTLSHLTPSIVSEGSSSSLTYKHAKEPMDGLDKSTDSNQCQAPDPSYVRMGEINRGKGQAGELLVMADLYMSGFLPFKAPEGASFDVGVILDDRLIKVQVKTTSISSNVKGSKSSPSYSFKVSRKSRQGGGKYKNAKYTRKEADVIALVGLEHREIAFLANDPDSIPWFVTFQSKLVAHPTKARFFSDHSFTDALKSLGIAA